ncbi:MuDR family transposase [Melia azedarach]|uniref:MuDR family transposase n=1 Tax=Melia azedarach TaxID=155640 RepID=A0ACC1Y314_MELAZ|nr:MuDR family transposase [Melia azedarach]
MDLVRFPVVFDGEWVNTDGKYKFNGRECKGVMLSPSSSYEDMLKTVARIINANLLESKITMKFAWNSPEPLPPTEITGDEDVRFFMAENRVARTPLYVTIESMSGSGPAKDCIDEVSKLKNDQPGVGSREEVLATFDQVEPLGNADTEGISPNNLPNEVEVPHDEVPNTPHAQPNKSPPSVSSRSSRPAYKDRMPRISLLASSKKVVADPNAVRSTEKFTSSDLVNHSGHNDGVYIKALFKDKEELQTKISLLALQKNFEYRVARSSKNILVLKCISGDCKWRLRAAKLKGSDFFQVRKYYPVHTCSLDIRHRNHRQASSKLISKCIKARCDGVARSYRPGSIREDILKQFGVNISYDKAWRAREYALQSVKGSLDESFSLLPAYCEMLEKKNPGTVTHIETDSLNHFKYFFMALGSSIRGFRSSIRPVIAVDRTFLKGKYRGIMFVAVCKDGNNQTYPLAFGIGNSEDDVSWNWIFTKLRDCVGDVEDLVFITDDNMGIRKGITSVFPNANHGACVYHIGQNLKAKFKDVNVHELFFKAASLYRQSEFNDFMAEIRKVDQRADQYLVEIGYENWARAHFDGRRYGIMSINTAECMSAILQDALELPITKLVDHIREILQLLFWERRNEAINMNNQLTNWAEGELQLRHDKSLSYHVLDTDLQEFIVKDGFFDDKVNLNDRMCSCQELQLEQLPCQHALAVCRFGSISCYTLCSAFYSSEALVAAYAESIYPVGIQEEWDVSEEVRNRIILPPSKHRTCEHPMKKRKQLQSEEKTVRKCGRCGSLGHNRKTCKAEIADMPGSTSC